MELERSSARNTPTGPAAPAGLSGSAARCRRKFLRFFPKGFYDAKYISWERGYKWAAHERWLSLLNKREYGKLLSGGETAEIAARAIKAESSTNLIFSFEKMALRDALRSADGAHTFAVGLYDLAYGRGKLKNRFSRWCEAVESLPKILSRVFTHPVVTVFGFLANPDEHIYLKPTVTRRAAAEYGFDLTYESRPSWKVYSSLLGFAETIGRDLTDLRPRDMIDIQSFIWVLGSDEYR
jgi:hypothetical protein